MEIFGNYWSLAINGHWNVLIYSKGWPGNGSLSSVGRQFSLRLFALFMEWLIFENTMFSIEYIIFYQYIGGY